MTSKELRSILPDKDIPIILFNAGCYCEWYGVENLSSSAIAVFDNAVYITMCNEIDSSELESIKDHYDNNYVNLIR